MKTRLTVEIDDKLKSDAKSKAYAQKKTLKQVIIELLNKWLGK
jgi:hypothetical protein